MSRVTHINTYAKVFKQGLILKYKLALYWEQSTLKKKKKTLRDTENNGKEKDIKNYYSLIYFLNIKPKYGDPLAGDVF